MRGNLGIFPPSPLYLIRTQTISHSHSFQRLNNKLLSLVSFLFNANHLTQSSQLHCWPNHGTLEFPANPQAVELWHTILWSLPCSHPLQSVLFTSKGVASSLFDVNHLTQSSQLCFQPTNNLWNSCSVVSTHILWGLFHSIQRGVYICEHVCVLFSLSFTVVPFLAVHFFSLLQLLTSVFGLKL